MPRRRKKRTRRKPAFSILNALEAYVYAAIITEGVAGTSPWGLITGKTDLTSHVTTGGVGRGDLVISGQGEISLGDMMSNPSLALDTMQANFQSNLMPMAVAAFTTSLTFRIGRKLLRRPISNINRNIMKPALGAGIRL
tara:strand:- start:227 stop:643 length:417 start_codon:yes stop_codon:yes gene_type:complete